MYRELEYDQVPDGATRLALYSTASECSCNLHKHSLLLRIFRDRSRDELILCMQAGGDSASLRKAVVDAPTGYCARALYQPIKVKLPR